MSEQMNELLDETLDDLADMPTSAPFVAGAHVCDMFITKPDPKKPWFYVVKFKHKGQCELSDPTSLAPKEGDEAALFIHTQKKDNGGANEIGQGQLKMILTPLAERLGIKSIPALVEATKAGIEVGIVSGIKEQKAPYPPQMQLLKLQLS